MAVYIIVFVYGTLKTDEPNHHVLQNARGRYEKLGEGRTLSPFPLVIASRYNIPFLLAKRGHGKRVIGEVYRMDDEKLAELDRLEGHPSFYTRQQHQVEMEDGRVVIAWMYMLSQWREDIFRHSTACLDIYSAKGNHDMEYIPPHMRGKSEVDKNGSSYNVVNHIRGEE